MPLIFIKLTWTIFRNMYIIKYLLKNNARRMSMQREVFKFVEVV
jgi:hypothetical protein